MMRGRFARIHTMIEFGGHIRPAHRNCHMHLSRACPRLAEGVFALIFTAHVLYVLDTKHSAPLGKPQSAWTR
jgi:hypothetical protein